MHFLIAVLTLLGLLVLLLIARKTGEMDGEIKTLRKCERFLDSLQRADIDEKSRMEVCLLFGEHIVEDPGVHAKRHLVEFVDLMKELEKAFKQPAKKAKKK